MSLEAIHACPYNYVPQVTSQFRLAKKILLNDTSTREGEQASEVSLGVDGKIALFRKLASIGFTQAQLGYPGKSKTDRDVVRRVKDENIGIKIEGIASFMFGDWRTEIDAAIDSGVDVLGLQYPISDIRLREVQKVERVEMRRLSVQAVSYAKNRGAPVLKFTGTDTLRADLEFVKEVYRAVVDAGADRVSIADTSGGALPSAVRYFVGEVVDAVDVPVQVHFHDDFGLALANTLASVEVGAQIVDVSINGLGERAGNASTDEVVTALKVFYGVDLGIKMEEMKPLSEFFSELTGVPIYPYKALVGDYAFAHKLDQHVKGILSNPAAYETIGPEAVGNRRKIPIGKYTGKFAIQYKLKEMGLSASEDEIGRIKEEIETLAIKKRAALTDAELVSIVKNVKGS